MVKTRFFFFLFCAVVLLLGRDKNQPHGERRVAVLFRWRGNKKSSELSRDIISKGKRERKRGEGHVWSKSIGGEEIEEEDEYRQPFFWLPDSRPSAPHSHSELEAPLLLLLVSCLASQKSKNAPNASSTFYFIFCPIRNVCGLLGGRSMSQPMFHTLPVLASGFFFLSFALREPEKLLPVFALGRPGHTFFSSSTCGSLSDLLLTVSFFSLLSKMDTQCAITKRQSLVGRLFLSFPWEKENTHGYSHLLGIMLTVRCLFGFFFPGLSTYHLDILGHPEQFDIVTQIKIRSEKLRVFTLRG